MKPILWVRCAGEGKWLVALLFISSVLMCIVHALSAGIWADFLAFNCDFQNYNVIRRFLDGQTAYADFGVYLGYGHILLGGILTWAFGAGCPDFMSSKMAFQFLPIFSISVMIYAIFRAVLYKNGKVLPLIAVNVILLLLLTEPEYFVNIFSISDDFYLAMHASMSTGWSARFLRGMAPAVAVAMIFLLYRLKCRIPFIDKSEVLSLAIVYGIPSGLIFYFSNDYGVASSVSISVIVFLIVLTQKGKLFEKLTKLSAFILASAAAFVFFGTAITQGHFSSYLSLTFASGGAQAWYYITPKSYYLWDMDLCFWSCVQAAVVLIYLFILLKKGYSKENAVRFGIPLFFNMAGYAAENEYKLLSGYTLQEVSYSILYLTFCAEGISLVIRFINKKTGARPVARTAVAVCVALLSVSWSISTYAAIQNGFSADRGDYVKNLGYFRDKKLAKSVESANEFMKAGDNVFSTYASAVETYRNQYQPSGTDYIIHVLGNDARSRYIKSFKKADPSYVATLRGTYTDWEYWVRNANWFFYRDLYQHYKPVYASGYQLFWKKSNEDQLGDISNAGLRLEKIDDHNVRVSVNAPNITYGIADVDLKYQVKKKTGLRSLFIINKMVRVSNESSFNLTNASKDRIYYLSSTADGTKNTAIGIPIVNGIGSVVLTSMPNRDTSFDYFDASLTGVYDGGYFSSLIVLGTEIKAGECLIKIANTPENSKIAENASEIRINGKGYPATFTTEGDNILIRTSALGEMSVQNLTGHTYFPVIQVAGSDTAAGTP
jgi:hypothetical protein